MDWKKITETAVQALIVSIVLGACTIVWKGATTVSDKVNASEKGLKATINVVDGAVADLNKRVQNTENKLDEIIKLLNKEDEVDEIVFQYTPIPLMGEDPFQIDDNVLPPVDDAAVRPTPTPNTAQYIEPMQQQMQQTDYQIGKKIKEEINKKW